LENILFFLSNFKNLKITVDKELEAVVAVVAVLGGI